MLCRYPTCQLPKHWKIEITTITYPIKEHDNLGSNLTILQTIIRAQAILTDRFIKNLKTVTLPSGHHWSELDYYKQDRFKTWRYLTCHQPMGKKDRHRNSILYPEYFTSLTDDNYIAAAGDDEHHGDLAHLYASYHQSRNKKQYL